MRLLSDPKCRSYLVAAGFALVIAGMAISFFAQRDDPVVRLGEVECVAAQRAYDNGNREKVLFDIIRDCDRSGFPIKR